MLQKLAKKRHVYKVGILSFMSKLTINREMVSKNKIISCSTPERQADSPSRDSDSLCDSDAASPVPFLCTQDGAEGETDVVWNFYTPTSKHAAKTRHNDTTPLSRKSKRSLRQKLIEKPPPKRRGIKPSQKKTELFQELLELKQNLHDMIPKKKDIINDINSGSEDDIFNDTQEFSPKPNRRLSSHCLRKNLLSSNYAKPDTDNALESDDSMNECLLKASQVVEEVILQQDIIPPKRKFNDSRKQINMRDINADVKFKMDHDSMDAILNSICLDSPVLKRIKCESPRLDNDSFDILVENLNDSELDRLTQLPTISETAFDKPKSEDVRDWSVKELVVHESPSKSGFGRHNSMPESPSVHTFNNQPSTSSMSFGRYNSMPHENKAKTTVPDLSPVRCTPEEIKKKHQLAKEKLLAKRLLPFTSSQCTQPTQKTKPTQFKLKIPSPRAKSKDNNNIVNVKFVDEKLNSETVDIKSIIEKKRQEALMRLRKRQPQSKIM